MDARTWMANRLSALWPSRRRPLTEDEGSDPKALNEFPFEDLPADPSSTFQGRRHPDLGALLSTRTWI